MRIEDENQSDLNKSKTNGKIRKYVNIYQVVACVLMFREDLEREQMRIYVKHKADCKTRIIKIEDLR